MSPARSEQDETRGWIIPVGGAEEKVGHPKILQRFVRLSGGDEAKIAIIPTASALDETGTQYEDLFVELGAHKAKSLPYRERRRHRGCGLAGHPERSDRCLLYRRQPAACRRPWAAPPSRRSFAD